MRRRTGGKRCHFMTIVFVTITGKAELEMKRSWKKPKCLTFLMLFEAHILISLSLNCQLFKSITSLHFMNCFDFGFLHTKKTYLVYLGIHKFELSFPPSPTTSILPGKESF